MELRTALAVVWDDVADSVYSQPTIHEAVRYARVEATDDELRAAGEDSPEDWYVELADGTQHSVAEAYGVVRAADQADVDREVAHLV